MPRTGSLAHITGAGIRRRRFEPSTHDIGVVNLAKQTQKRWNSSASSDFDLKLLVVLALRVIETSAIGAQTQRPACAFISMFIMIRMSRTHLSDMWL